jgi:hypothetical protein
MGFAVAVTVYSELGPDEIIVSDDFALQFVVKTRKTLGKIGPAESVTGR